MGEEDQGDRALGEAADWMTRLNARSVASDTLEAFYEWRRQPGNAAAYAKVEQVWQQCEQVGGDRDIALAVRDALARPRWQRRLAGLGDLARRRPLGTIVAAFMLFGVMGTGAFLWPRGTPYATMIGEQRMVQLDDGSRIRLDTATRLRVRFSRSERRIDLIEGQAFFEVAHDRIRPFSVHVGDASVVAVGTQFDVRAEKEVPVVMLVEGRLALRDRRDRGGDRALVPGQRSEASNEGWSAPEPADVATLTSWTTGWLKFRDMPLREAIAEVNRYTAHPLILEDGTHANQRVNGSFRSGAPTRRKQTKDKIDSSKSPSDARGDRQNRRCRDRS